MRWRNAHMSALASPPPARAPSVEATPRMRRSAPTARLVLLGTGTVGAAFVARHQRLDGAGMPLPRLHMLANARGQVRCDGDTAGALRALVAMPRRTPACDPNLATMAPGDVVV